LKPDKNKGGYINFSDWGVVKLYVKMEKIPMSPALEEFLVDEIAYPFDPTEGAAVEMVFLGTANKYYKPYPKGYVIMLKPSTYQRIMKQVSGLAKNHIAWILENS
jgi:hypothetical protein